jgi:hypothetical protein
MMKLEREKPSCMSTTHNCCQRETFVLYWRKRLRKDGTCRMSEPHHASSAHHDGSPWWIRLCRWLWKLSAFLGISVLFSVVTGVLTTWLTTPKGAMLSNTPLGDLMKQWPLFLLAWRCLVLIAIVTWAISHWAVPVSALPLTPHDRQRILRRLRRRSVCTRQGCMGSLFG